MSERLAGRIALVTGSTSGIGKGVALGFAREGAKVVVTGRREELGRRTVAEIKAEGGEAAFCRADIALKEDVLALSRFVGDTYGGLDVLVNNAAPAARARAEDGSLADSSEDLWDDLYNTNLRGACLVSKYVMPFLIKSGRGSVINIASIHALRGTGWDAYSMIKGSIVALTRSMAVGYSGDHVRVNCVCPGLVRIERNVDLEQEGASFAKTLRRHLTPPGQPEHIAHFCTYLASDESEYVTGSIFSIDGGANAKWGE
ncbi:MAG: SDR family oxidoreductase [Chloroflexi bacterium]|nr:SDR family oxidoreductase [Chloroflexota bacterium]MCL5108060.1 SDR family oxidoreductase [Chloroflexota bacterium]